MTAFCLSGFCYYSMKKLDKITIICADTRSYAQALASLRKSLDQITPAKTIFFTDIDLPLQEGIEIIKINPIRSKAEYSTWIIRELWKYIDTEFVLVIQWDGYIINSDAWRDEFYEYDYLGAPWIYEHNRNIANGGFSLRSKRLCEILGTDPLIQITHPEDQSIGILYRGYLEEKHDIKFPSEELADTFAFELKEPIGPVFGFHGFFHKPFQEVVVIQRRAALGDVIHLEPVMHYFYKNGYKVVLDTLPQFFNLFLSHYFKIHHPEEIDRRLLAKARVINLDLAYERTPKQLHLKSYYEMSGIMDGEIRNPKLTLPFNPKITEAKLFPQYIVLHIDKRIQDGRNIYEVDWEKVCEHLNDLGFTVIQIGHGEHEVLQGATEMRNMNEPMLMRLIGGADFFIGVDSGPFNIALAMNTPAIVFFGSVHPDYIIPDKSKVVVIQNHNAEKPICRNPHCWSSVIGETGVECIEIEGKKKFKIQSIQGMECQEDEPIPPCVQFSSTQVLEAIDKILLI